MDSHVYGLCTSGCVVCQLYDDLIAEGAIPQLLMRLQDEQCIVHIEYGTQYQCTVRLRLDTKKASYRKTHGDGVQSKMCDFAEITLRGVTVSLSVMELKGGRYVRIEHAVQQLAAGLKVLDLQFSSDVSVKPSAYLIAEYQLGPLQQLLATQKTLRLAFREETLVVEVVGCGEKVSR